MDSVHLSDSTIYGSSRADPELCSLFTEQSKIGGWLDVITVLAKVQAKFGLIPM
jgi:adenylosuccinate lyase